jgi:iron complex transport system substrate-binding protein
MRPPAAHRFLLPIVLAGALAFAAEAVSAGLPVAKRVVSMNPSLTRMLVAISAHDVLVGVDAFSARSEPSVRDLPQVGGLFDPSLEAVIALEPDLVVVVPSVAQRDFRDRLRALDIGVLELPNITLDQLLGSIVLLGERVGRGATARERVAEIERVWSVVKQARLSQPRPSAVLVLQRDPLYVAGQGGFLSAMLSAAGVANAARFEDPYPRVGIEWLIATAPEVIIDSTDDPTPAAEYWARWPSIPAVSNGRVVEVPAGVVTLPGPYLDRSLHELVSAIESGSAFEREPDAAP